MMTLLPLPVSRKCSTYVPESTTAPVENHVPTVVPGSVNCPFVKNITGCDGLAVADAASSPAANAAAMRTSIVFMSAPFCLTSLELVSSHTSDPVSTLQPRADHQPRALDLGTRPRPSCQSATMRSGGPCAR